MSDLEASIEQLVNGIVNDKIKGLKEQLEQVGISSNEKSELRSGDKKSQLTEEYQLQLNSTARDKEN